MPRRPAFRPAPPESLERRDVPSRLGALPSPAGHATQVLRAARQGAAASLRIPTVGALGDSYTDEYRTSADDRHVALNWVELLAATRRASFGPYAVRSLGPPQNQGYADNWALGGATSDEMVSQQLPGLTAQVAAGQVQVAWIFIGADDLLYNLEALATSNPSGLSPSAVQADIAGVFARIGANTTRAVNTLLAANPGVRVVVATLPDVGQLPIVQEAVAVDPQARAFLPAVSAATQQYDAQLRAEFATNPRVAIADFAALSGALLSQSSGGAFNFGGIAVNSAQPGDSPDHLFLADGIHIGTVGQGLLGDLFLQTIDTRFGYRVPLLSPRQIVVLAYRATR